MMVEKLPPSLWDECEKCISQQVMNMNARRARVQRQRKCLA
jgi:hypothetical protein